MKYILLYSLCFLAMGLHPSHSQTVDGVSLEELEVDYIQVSQRPKFMNNKVSIRIDFGQEQTFWDSKTTHLKDKNGKEMMFNSMMAALNYLKTFNFHFLDTFSEAYEDGSITFFILERKRENPKDD